MSVSIRNFYNQANLSNEVSLEVTPFFDTVDASLGYTYDPMLETMYNKVMFSTVDMEYSPQDDIEGYEEFQSHLLYARNQGHMTSMKRGIDENKARREVLANSSFWAQLGAGVFDPVNLIALPFGGPALTLGKAALRGAAGVGALQTGLEAIRYPVDPLATISESALNIGFAAVTGGFISGAISVPMVRRNNALNKTIDSANESYNEGLEFTTLGQMDTEQLKIAQSKPARKLFLNKTDVDLRNESSLNSKTVFGYDKAIESGFFKDGTPIERNALLNIQAKKVELTKGNVLIDQELAIRRLDRDGVESTDKYKIAIGGWAGALISTPFKRILNSKVPDKAKKAIVQLAADSGFLLNLHKLGLTEGPSTYQRAKIMDGEWVGAQSELMKLYGDSIKIRIKSIGGAQIKDVSTRIGNKFSKQKNQTSDDFFREINRKRTTGEKASNASEAEAIEVINKFFKKWEERLEEVGFIGSKKRIESLIAESKIKKDRIVNDFSKYKTPRSDWVNDHNARLNRLDAQLEEWEFSLATMSEEGFAPVKKEAFFPRYWNHDYIKTNRAALAKVLKNWYTKNPYTYEIDSNLKWGRVDLITSDQAIVKRVEKTIDNILGLRDGEDVPNVGAGKSKHTKHRVLDIPNELVWDFIIQDPLAVMKGYTQKIAGKYQFAKMNNGKSLLDVLDENIQDMHVAGNSRQEIDAWRKDYVALHDATVASPMKSSPDRWDNRTAYYLKEAAQLNYLGSAGLSAIPDFAKIIMEHEMGDVIKGLQALLTDTRVTLKGEEAKLVGEAIELIQGNSHFRIVDHITNDITSTNTYDRIKNTFYLANGLAPITQFAKTLDSIIRGHSLINMSRKLAIPEKYGKASKLEVEDLARYNINKEIAMEIANAPYETTANGLILPNTLKWETSIKVDEETLTTFRTALQSGILNTIIMGTPADKPIIVSGVAYIPMRVAKAFNMPEDKIVKGYARVESGLLGLPFQFYSYSLGALSKISMSAAQGQMKNRAVGLSMSLGLGMLAVQIKTPDWAFEQMDWDDWFARGFDQSGIAAIYSDLFYTSMQTALAMGAPNITGGIIEPKFPSDDAYGAAIGIGGAGPSIGYDYASAMKEFFIDGNYSEGAKNFTRSLPGARMWFWKGLVNDWTNSFKNWF